MDNKVVVGVGNIYANEALFSSRIHPLRPASKVTKEEWVLLTQEIKQVLATAIKQGGTTLKDFAQADVVYRRCAHDSNNTTHVLILDLRQ